MYAFLLLLIDLLLAVCTIVAPYFQEITRGKKNKKPKAKKPRSQEDTSHKSHEAKSKKKTRIQKAPKATKAAKAKKPEWTPKKNTQKIIHHKMEPRRNPI